MVPISSSASTASSIDDSSEHNLWNPPLNLLFLKNVNGVVYSYLVDLDLAKIALSCHFALDLDLFVTRRKCSSLHDDTLGTIAPGGYYVAMAPLPLWYPHDGALIEMPDRRTMEFFLAWITRIRLA